LISFDRCDEFGQIKIQKTGKLKWLVSTRWFQEHGRIQAQRKVIQSKKLMLGIKRIYSVIGLKSGL
jgi:hypothetical protein